MQPSNQSSSAPILFQSAPDREAGRCVIRVKHYSLRTEFQSAPDREAGRCDNRGMS